MNKIKIAGRSIGIDYPPYVIAEMSANHNGDIQTAMGIIREAKKSGADAVKLQTYTPDTITLDSDNDDFIIKGGLWNGRTLYDLYQEAHMPWDWHKPLFDYGRQIGITIFSSVFDSTAIDLLEDLNTPAYKIASFEAVDLELIKYAAGTGKPLIISTGMANADEISEAIKAAREGGCKELAILHCVSAYPALAEDYNLHTVSDMIQRYKLVTGLSDHTLDNITAIASVALGASIIEKHFTLDPNGVGPDDSFSLGPEKLVALCGDLKKTWLALGKVNYERKSSEQDNIKLRRSLYFVTEVDAGTPIEAHHVRSIRPGYGLPPKEYQSVIGRILKKDVKKGTPVTYEILD